MRAIPYVRFSPRRDEDTSESNVLQLDMIRDYCAKQGHVVVAEFADDAISGDDEDRPGLWAAVDALKRGYVLVAYKADRLARSVYLSEYIQRAVRKKGATIEIVTGSRNGDSPEDVFVRQVLAAFSELEKKVIAARTKAGMLTRQAQGQAMSKRPPFGMQPGPESESTDRFGNTVVKRTWIESPTELDAIARILEQQRQGCGAREIARNLNAAGVPCRGSQWRHGLVQRICERHSIATNAAVR